MGPILKLRKKSRDSVCCAQSILVFLTSEILNVRHYHLIVFQLSMTTGNPNSAVLFKFSLKLFLSGLQSKLKESTNMVIVALSKENIKLK